MNAATVTKTIISSPEAMALEALIKALTNTKKAGVPVKMHFEMKADAYQKLKTSFDEVRQEIDLGMFGNTPEWRALRSARSKLFEMGELLKTELIIVTDSSGESEHVTGGQS